MVALSTLLWISAKPIIKFLLFAGCGAVMAKHGLLTPAGAKVISGLIFNYTLPALLFAKIVTCVSPDNVDELGFVALIAVLYIMMGAVFGLMIQRTKLVPKRLYWGIVAATMFTNFGDLPISILLAVSDHPPFLVGDGARGTAYSSVFISVFYLFLFPLGGYRLIRCDHVKESKRLQSLTATIQEHQQSGTRTNGSNDTSPGDLGAPRMNMSQQQSHHQSPYHLPSPEHHHVLPQDPNGLQFLFSATSSTINVDYMVEENAKELSYCPYDQEVSGSFPRERRGDTGMNPFVQQGFRPHAPTDSDSSGCSYYHPLHPLQVLGVAGTRRYSAESMASNGTGGTRFSSGHDDHCLIKPTCPATTSSSSSPSRKNSLQPPLFNSTYQLPPLHPLSSGSSHSSRFNSTPSNPLPPVMFGAGVSNVAGRVDSRIATDGMATVSLSELGMSSSSQPNGTLSGKAAVKENPTPVPKVPPHLEKSYESNHNTNTHWFWRAFHSAREYLTPPTIGLIFGLVSTLTPLRGLFVVTPNPFPSPDELPPLSFLLEVTLMLGACCVPLGLTVLGASLSRLKPGRLQPMIPVLTMITTVKLAISPCIGILLVQLVLVKQLGWISVQNHILQFTLMLMSGSPTSIMCFVLAQVWDRRTKNAGSEMAALIAVQYAVATVLLTIGSASMMYFLF